MDHPDHNPPPDEPDRKPITEASAESPANELDELIRCSLRVDVDPQSVERLEQFWRQQSQVERAPRLWHRRAWQGGVLAVAASLLVTVWLVWPVGGPQLVDQQPPAPVDSTVPTAPAFPTAPSDPQPAESGSSQLVDAWPPSSSATSDDAPAAMSAGRTPTTYERMMFAALTHTPAAGPAPRAPAPRIPAPRRPAAGDLPNPPLTDWVAQSIARAERDPKFKFRQELNRLLPSQQARVSSLLLAKLPTAEGDSQAAICRLLADTGAPECISELLKLGAARGVGDEALAAIEAIAGVERWLEVARQCPDPQVRQAIAARLLTRGDRRSLLAFLSLVYDESLRHDALAAADDLRELPIKPLVALLDHANEPVRLATALALGRMNRCEMTTALITRVSKRPSRSKEAWFALLACRCDAADEFLAHATRSPRLLGQLNNARVQWARVVP